MKAQSFRPAGRRYVLGVVFDFAGRNVLLHSTDGTSYGAFGGVALDRERSQDAMVRCFGAQAPSEVREGDLSWRGFGRMVVKDEGVWLFYVKVRLDVLETISCGVGKLMFRVVPVSSLMSRAGWDHCTVDPKLCYLVPMAVNHARGIDDVLFYEIVLTDQNFGEGT